jgi:tetratricopeptide (TPR) repeat protein
MAGVSLTTLPLLFFAPGLLGTVPADAGLGRMFFAVVNIHHFVLDGTIWKLRDGPIARALLRAEPATPVPIVPRNPLGQRLVWAIGVTAIAIALVDIWEFEFGVRRPFDRGDAVRMEVASQRLWWIGRDSHAVHFNLGLLLAKEGRYPAARGHLERSLALYPTVNGWTALGNVERIEGRHRMALAALDNALALDDEFAAAHKRRGETLASLGELDAALAALREAHRLDPDNPNIRASLQSLEQTGANPDATGPPEPSPEALRSLGDID